MALNFGKFNGFNFKHSSDFSQGGGRERKGQGEIIVALDGTGDFDSLEEAIKTIPWGGKIFLKSGTYQLIGKLFIPNNTTIEGTGADSIIKTTTTATYPIVLNNKSNIIIKNLCFYLRNGGGVEAGIDINAAENVFFDYVLFKIGAAMGTIMWGVDGASATNFKISNCKVDITEASTSFLFGSAFSKTQVTKNRFDTIGLIGVSGAGNLITNSIITSNFFKTINFEAGSNNNTCIGNQTDFAITNAGAGNQIANNCVF